jgi:hypothetical protein
VLPEVMTVSVEFPFPFNEVGLKFAVAPPGNPSIPKLTLPVNPPFVESVTAKFVLPPGKTDCDDGLAPSENVPTITLTCDV